VLLLASLALSTLLIKSAIAFSSKACKNSARTRSPATRYTELLRSKPRRAGGGSTGSDGSVTGDGGAWGFCLRTLGAMAGRQGTDGPQLFLWGVPHWGC
jgi:hypothetical protein